MGRLRGAVIASTAARATTESTANLTTDDVTKAWPRQRSPACAACSAFLMSPEVTITARLGSHRTPRWRKTDSNLWSHFQRGQRFRARHSVSRSTAPATSVLISENDDFEFPAAKGADRPTCDASDAGLDAPAIQHDARALARGYRSTASAAATIWAIKASASALVMPSRTQASATPTSVFTSTDATAKRRPRLVSANRLCAPAPSHSEAKTLRISRHCVYSVLQGGSPTIWLPHG
jgi:hypothetical protein